ncbi:MAG TPA: extracellular solute-binding protein, partial [Aestuariivirgaceae bacterium]|nr:extracellular solute-binding protein [Aestuariivirgaceae bacterium]
MNSDLTRSMFPLLSRRTVLKSGFAAAAAAGLIPVRAHAASTVTFLGWQGYDDPITFDDFTKTKEITLNTTYIGNNDEIVTKLRSGGIGQIDIVTPYMGYIPLLVKLDVIQPIDTARVPNLEKIIPLFRNDPNVNVDGKLYSVPFTWGSGPMMYDPAIFPNPPASWMDLLKPEYTGKVGMMDDP